MFKKPIKHVRLKSFDELEKFSHLIPDEKGKTKTYCMKNNGDFVFCDELGLIWVTPYRSEIPDILHEAGYYEEDDISYSAINNEEYYKWLRKMADEEKWAEFCEKVLELSEKKGIKPVEFNQKVQVKEIKSKYEEHKWILSPMMKQGYFNENMGTYICLDDKSVLVCDEYGRTFLISVKTTINDVVNALIDSGYTRTLSPQLYVKENKNDKNNNE